MKYAFSEEHRIRRGGVVLERLEAVVVFENVGSAKVLEKNGFELECVLKKKFIKYGKLHDGKFYVKFRQ